MDKLLLNETKILYDKKKELAERQSALNRLEILCNEHGIALFLLDNQMGKCIVYFKRLALLIVASNCEQKQIVSMVEFILDMLRFDP